MDTLKRLIVGFVVVLVGFAATGCAAGRYGSPLEQVMANNNDMLCSISGDVFIGAPINRCLQDIGGNFGRYSNYPMYRGGMGGSQLSQADKLSIFCGLGASGAAMLLDATVKQIFGAGLLSTAACEAVAAVSGRGQGQGGQPGGVRYAADGTPIALPDRPVQVINPNLWGPGAPFNRRQNCLQEGLVTLKNETGELLKVFIEGQYQKPEYVLQPRVPQCAQPDLRYVAQTKETVVSSDGWVGGTDHAPVKPERRPGLVLVWR